MTEATLCEVEYQCATRHIRPPVPEDIPGELWFLWHGYGFVGPVDYAPGGPSVLCCASREAAEAAARHQFFVADIACIPIRVM